MTTVPWLDRLKHSFSSTHLNYQDLLYIIERSVLEERVTFPQFIHDASMGEGTTVREGLSYSLDQDWTHPEDFDAVTFFVGDMESSSLSVPDFLVLMQTAAEVYLTHVPADSEPVLRSLKRLEARYAKKPIL